MYRRTSALIAILVLNTVPMSAQVPAELDGRLLFQLGGTDAGHEDFRVKRVAGGYQLSADVDLQVMGLHIVQHIEVEADARLALRAARLRSAANQDSLTMKLTRKDGRVLEERTQGDSIVSSWVESPDASILLTNNVIHHIVQFAWLHDGGVGESRDFLAYPRVPVTVRLEGSGTLQRDADTLTYRRYYLNLANRIGVYVWLGGDGTPLKVLVPLQSFAAVEAGYQGWAELLDLQAAKADVPSAASGYASEEVRFGSDSIELAGTLTLPGGKGPWPAVVLVSGSGPQDRDEDSPGPGGLKLGIFRSVADTLSKRGFAVLRYDDRGVGASGGDLRTAGLSDLVGDVQAAVRYLRSRPEIDGARVALVGHSEGGIIAPIVASGDPQIAAIVLMAGTATPLDSVILDQVVSAAREAGADTAEIEQARSAIRKLMQAVRDNRDLEDLGLPAALEMLAGSEKWLREHLAHDPLSTISKVRAPVLIVNGAEDVQVPPDHAHRLAAALRAAGHDDFEVRIFPRLNHLFVVSRGEGTAEYSDPEAHVDPEFLGALTEWLRLRLGRADRS